MGLVKHRSIVKMEVIRKWSNENLELARKALLIPPVPQIIKTTSYSYSQHYEQINEENVAFTSLERYLQWRNWLWDTTYQSQTATNDPSEAIDDHLKKSASEDTFREEKKMTTALLSHTLTFPLTLASKTHAFLRPKLVELAQKQKTLKRSTTDNDSGSISSDYDTDTAREQHEDVTIRLCCVGGRAETTLPIDYWKEFLLMMNHPTQNDDKNNGNVRYGDNSRKPPTSSSSSLHQKNKRIRSEAVNVNWVIDFVGPDVQWNDSKVRSVEVSTNDVTAMESPTLPVIHKSLTMSYQKYYLHDYVTHLYYQKRNEQSKEKEEMGMEEKGKKRKKMTSDESDPNLTNEILNTWDGYVMFNPGMGHPNLIQSWQKTIKFVMKVKRPILFTAHSDYDGERDAKMLFDTLMREEEKKENDEKKRRSESLSSKLRYEENAFASRLQYKDPFPCKAETNDKKKANELYDNGREEENEKEDEGVHWIRPNHSILMYYPEN